MKRSTKNMNANDENMQHDSIAWAQKKRISKPKH